MNILYTEAIRFLRGVNKGYGTFPRLRAMGLVATTPTGANTFKSLANQKILEKLVRKLPKFYLFRFKATPQGV